MYHGRYVSRPFLYGNNWVVVNSATATATAARPPPTLSLPVDPGRGTLMSISTFSMPILPRPDLSSLVASQRGAKALFDLAARSSSWFPSFRHLRSFLRPWPSGFATSGQQAYTETCDI